MFLFFKKKQTKRTPISTVPAKRTFDEHLDPDEITPAPPLNKEEKAKQLKEGDKKEADHDHDKKKIRDERKEASQKELQLGEKEAKEKETREKTETRGDLQLTRQRKQGLFVFVYNIVKYSLKETTFRRAT